jgi:hypothetical protein
VALLNISNPGKSAHRDSRWALLIKDAAVPNFSQELYNENEQAILEGLTGCYNLG